MLVDRISVLEWGWGGIRHKIRYKIGVPGSDSGSFQNFGSWHEVSWEEPNVVRLNRTLAQDKSGWGANGKTAIGS